MMQFGIRLRTARDAAHMTLNRLAELSGVSKGYISQIENGLADSPGVDVALRLAVALGIGIDDLVRDDVVVAIAQCETRVQSAPLAKCPHCGATIRLRLTAEGSIDNASSHH